MIFCGMSMNESRGPCLRMEAEACVTSSSGDLGILAVIEAILCSGRSSRQRAHHACWACGQRAGGDHEEDDTRISCGWVYRLSGQHCERFSRVLCEVRLAVDVSGSPDYKKVSNCEKGAVLQTAQCHRNRHGQSPRGL